MDTVFVLLTLLAIIMILAAGFISGLFDAAKDEPKEKRPRFVEDTRIYIAGKFTEYTLLIVALYLFVVTSGVIIAALYYLFMEYGLPRLLKPLYQKYFGLPSGA